jgi:outer membrane biosynthesis protein TonB
MSEAVRRTFDAQEITIACAIAVLAQLFFVLAFSLPSPKLIEAEISNDNAQPIAVSITPVLKLGSKNPTKLPTQWTRRTPPPPPKQEQAPLPSPQAAKTPDAIPKTNVADAAPPQLLPEAGPTGPTAGPVSPATSGSATTASSVQGSEQGAANGTETDPLKARAADMYRAQLASWFASRFQIRGKVPFDTLKKLHAAAVVTVTGDRKVGSFSVVKPSGDATFDAEVQATLARIQSGGAELPAPPPMYPDMLGQSLPVGFQCTVQKFCE